MKMPEPTKTVCAPSCIIRAASAGVAMPPAEKFGHGELAGLRDHLDELVGGAKFLGRGVEFLRREKTVSALISEVILRMCLTAWMTSPVPGSPLVRIMAAPSEMRRRASPRSFAPQTKGVLKACLSMWWSSSAGVRTSDSSMKSTASCSRICASTKCPIRTFAMTGMVTAFWMALIMPGWDMRATPPWRGSWRVRARAP